jgi:hypothetical protein
MINLAGTGHLNSGPFKYQSPFIRLTWFSNGSAKLDRFTQRKEKNDFPLKTLPSLVVFFVPARISNGLAIQKLDK